MYKSNIIIMLYYSLDINGKIDAASYTRNLGLISDENTPFDDLYNSRYWKFVNSTWQKYDPDWIYPEFPFKVQMSYKTIADDANLTLLISHVQGLIDIERCKRVEMNNSKDVDLYFIEILPDHLAILQANPEVTILELTENYLKNLSNEKE